MPRVLIASFQVSHSDMIITELSNASIGLSQDLHKDFLYHGLLVVGNTLRGDKSTRLLIMFTVPILAIFHRTAQVSTIYIHRLTVPASYSDGYQLTPVSYTISPFTGIHF